MDQPGETSDETDPVTQMKARTDAFGDDALIYGECTTSVEGGRITVEIEQGSNSAILLQCVHCLEWICPERPGFGGWQEAENALEAREMGRYSCEKCGVVWSEDDRQRSLLSPRLVHGGQVVSKRGVVTGDMPRTRVFGLRWNKMHSAMVKQANIAEQEWKASKLISDDDLAPGTSAEKALCQFTWVTTYKDPARAAALSYGLLARHAGDYHFDPLQFEDGELPDGVEFTVGSIDVQRNRLYWQIDGFALDLTRWTLCYGVEELGSRESIQDPTVGDLRRALDSVRLDMMEVYKCKSVWVDTGYKWDGAIKNHVRNWCKEQGPAVHALVGRGEGMFDAMNRGKGKALKLLPSIDDNLIQVRRQPDGSRLWFFQVDALKDDLFWRLFREQGSEGYHYFPREAANETRTDRSKGQGSFGWIFSHYMRCKRVMKVVGGHERRTWVEGRTQHLWDCGIYALAGAMLTAAELKDKAAKLGAVTVKKERPDMPNRPGKIRTKYS